MDHLRDKLCKISLGFYNNMYISRSSIQCFIDTLDDYVSDSLCNAVLQEAEKNLTERSSKEESLKVIRAAFKTSKLAFNDFKTEYKRFKYYEEKNLFNRPVEYVIGDRYEEKLVCSSNETSKLDIQAEYIPLSWSLKVLLEIPGAYHILKAHMRALYQETEIKKNPIQCALWNRLLKNYNNKFVIPYNIFQDDCETGNDKGSHAGKNKLGAVYGSIPCFPSHLSSRLENIILVILSHAKDRKLCSVEKMYGKLIAEMNELSENGLLIDVDRQPIRVYFQLFLLLGDNLGLNEMLGFSENFNSGCPCRVCTASIDKIKVMIKEDVSILRTKELYENADEKLKKKTGVKSNCIFNKVKGYHNTLNLSLDMMHDMFSNGVAHYFMLNTCDYMIYKKNYFSLQYLNKQLKKLPYKFLENSNKIPEIKEEHIKVKKNLKLCAAEMIYFTRSFSVLVGKKVPRSDPIWKLFIVFRRIISIILSPRYIETHLLLLDTYIPEFLSTYQKHFGELKYKFHNMIHIVRVMRENGPLIHFWSMRYESKHREIKAAAVSTSNKMNVLKTVSLRAQLRLAYIRLMKTVGFNELNCNTQREIDFRDKAAFWPNIKKDEKIFSTDSVNFNGIDYKSGMIYVLKLGDNNLPLFGEIVDIHLKENHVFLLLQQYQSVIFDDHYFAYDVVPQIKKILKPIDEIPDIHPCMMIKKKKRMFIITRYIL